MAVIFLSFWAPSLMACTTAPGGSAHADNNTDSRGEVHESFKF